MIPKLSWTYAAAALCLATNGAAAAKPHHRHHVTKAAPATPTARRAIPDAYSFYPERVQGGVPGNLPFNNQIRKLVDPLNANGAGR